MTSIIRLHTVPGSLQRIDKGIRDVDKAVAAMLALAQRHLSSEVTDSREFKRLSHNIVTARNHLCVVLAIELELEEHCGPEVFEVRV